VYFAVRLGKQDCHGEDDGDAERTAATVGGNWDLDCMTNIFYGRMKESSQEELKELMSRVALKEA
jgi:hypothetical protein